MVDLRESYYQALEVRHRVKIELLEQTVVGLQKISLSLWDFNWWAQTQGPISLNRVYKAVDLLVGIAKDDVDKISDALKKYRKDYEDKRAQATDDMFLKVTSDLETKLQLLYYRIQSLSNINADDNFTTEWQEGRQHYPYDPRFGGTWNYNLGDNDIILFENTKQLMIEVQYAAEAVKGWVFKSTLPTDASNKTYIPLTWHPGKEWTLPCDYSIENLTQLINSNVWGKVENNLYDVININDAFQFAYELFVLLKHVEGAKKCRMLYRDALEEAIKATDAANTSIHDFLQVNLMQCKCYLHINC